MSADKFKYDAFLSYAHEDEAAVVQLQRVLERAWVPGTRRRAIYRDHDRLQAGPLSEGIRAALQQSRFLIVCCSRNAAMSKWVNQEIDEFAHLRATAPAHATTAILACHVDSANGLAVPPALRWVCTELGDELYIPDVSPAQGATSRNDRRAARHAAFALLAPVIGLPDREAVYARVRKWKILLLAGLCVLSVALVGMWRWTRTDRFQIRSIAMGSRSTVLAAETFFSMTFLEALADSPYGNEAVTSARSFVDPDVRALAVASVAEPIAKTAGHHLAYQLLQEARGADIRDSDFRSMTLNEVASGLLALNNVVEAQSVARTAHETALTIEHPELRVTALCELLQTLTPRMLRQPTVAVSDDLLAAARDSRTSMGPKAYGLTCAATGMIDRSVQAMLLNDALRTAGEVAPARSSVQTLANMATLLAGSRMPQDAREAANAAFEGARLLPSTLRPFVIANNVLPALDAAGLESSIRSAAEMALSDTKTITDADSRARATASLLRWLNRFHTDATLTELAKKAVDDARRSDDADRRIDVLAQVAHDVAKARLSLAVDIARQAYALAPSHTDDRGRSVAYSQIAAAFAELGLFREARLAANLCGDSTDKLRGFRSILQAHATRSRTRPRADLP